MPTVDPDAKRWQELTAKRIGRAVQMYRDRRGLSASQLADRTRELGYPIHRVTISKIESGNRLGKVDVCELLVLAKALGTDPLSLVLPDLLDGEVELTPGDPMPTHAAIREFVGQSFDETSMRVYWDYLDLVARQRMYEQRGNDDAAHEAREQARQTIQWGVEHYGWEVRNG
ncbi:helix-turn-helix domain-containing protein [Mycolicibacter terrae]|uniref:Helix-turn-helix domain-containing protein n=1 Tax=Mycolicibacter terrae TaxID=1788 RepID=A0ACD2ERZ2_9MYCO|nr:helix-turn-helix transcriptional regulator [Mycolicibacter terrae]RRR47856.1 helix-turn-helix domain-containing protein [Mycolicibacter terrae]